MYGNEFLTTTAHPPNAYHTIFTTATLLVVKGGKSIVFHFVLFPSFRNRCPIISIYHLLRLPTESYRPISCGLLSSVVCPAHTPWLLISAHLLFLYPTLPTVQYVAIIVVPIIAVTQAFVNSVFFFSLSLV